MGETVSVARITDLRPGEGKVVQANGKQIALFNVDGIFYAIDNICLHRGGPLGEGILQDRVVTCPWHGWKYDVATGISPVNQEISVQAYQVEIVGEEVRVTV